MRACIYGPQVSGLFVFELPMLTKQKRETELITHCFNSMDENKA